MFHNKILPKFLLLVVFLNTAWSINSDYGIGDLEQDEVNNQESQDYGEDKVDDEFIEFSNTGKPALNPSYARSHQLVPPYSETPAEYKRVCMYPNWSILRDSNMARIYPEDIDPNLCTHIHYAYANIDVRTFQLAPSQYQDNNAGDHGAVSFLLFLYS